MGKITKGKKTGGGIPPSAKVGIGLLVLLICGVLIAWGARVLIAWGAGAFDSAESNTDSDEEVTEPGTEPGKEPGTEAEPVTCTWPQVRDEDNNVCVAAPDIPDGTVRTHQPCITDSDCMLGRCAGPQGDPGCYARYTCTARRLPEHGGPLYASIGDTAASRMGPCGLLHSVGGSS